MQYIEEQVYYTLCVVFPDPRHPYSHITNYIQIVLTSFGFFIVFI